MLMEMKNPFGGLISKLNLVKERINECEGRSTEITLNLKPKAKKRK